MTIDYLLLQTGDKLLLEDDSGVVLLEDSFIPDDGGGDDGGGDDGGDDGGGGDNGGDEDVTNITVNCPNLGLTVRTAPSGMTGVTTLRGKKVPYSHISHTLVLPAWLGGKSRVDAISQWGRGDLKARYMRDGGDALGGFNAVSKTISAPSASPLTLVVKENVGEAIYEWMRLMDLDVRLQDCGRVDDPTNWTMIKRLCECAVTDMSTSGETAYSPHDEGETMIKVQLTSPNKPVIIYPVDARQVDFYDESRFADYDYEPVVAAHIDCGYVIPAVSGTTYPMYMAAYGVDLEALTSGTPLLPYHPVDLASHDNVIVAVLSDGSVYWSGDYGKTFFQSIGLPSAAVVAEVWSYSNILVGCNDSIYSDGTVFQSTDGGRTFEQVDPYNAVTGDVVAFAYRDGKVVYVLDSNGNVSASEDNGETFVRAGTVPIDRPTTMIILNDVLMVGGYSSNVPVVVGSEDGGYTWYTLVRIQGSDVMPAGFPVAQLKLVVEACGVVDMSVVYSNCNGLYSDVYRNVNWGASGAWERIWQDAVSLSAYNGFIMLTDIASACVNDLLVVGRIMGDTPLYVGIKFVSES